MSTTSAPANGATSSAPAPAPAPVVDLGPLLARTERDSAIKLSSSAPRAPYGSSAFVTSGTRTVAKQTEDVLVIADGSSRQAFPQSAVLTAILGDVVPRDVIRAVWAAADKARES